MGLTFLMEQKDSGNRSVAAKVPYFAEMINERACLIWRRMDVGGWQFGGAKAASEPLF
jgi:hypothetical protein